MKWDLRIQGLRAFAILGVLAFHFFPSVFPRGYLGVDIFFVISGFVITQKILIQSKQPKWLRNFYIDRYKRLSPSLLLLFLVTTALVLIFTENIRNFMQEALYGLLYISNFYYFMHSDYFSISSYNQTFLHLWSLGIEVQFYLLFPLIFVLCKRHQILKILITLSLFSLAFFLFTTSHHPTFNFYSLVSRFWEFIFGALVVWMYDNYRDNKSIFKFLQHNITGLISFYGLLIILLTDWVQLSNQISTLACCFLSAVIIYSTFSPSILTNKVAQWAGFYSYEIYLIHWPIVSIYVYQIKDSRFSQPDFKLLLFVYILALSVIFSKIVKKLRSFARIEHILFTNVVIGIGILIFILGGINDNNSLHVLSGQLPVLEERKCAPAASSTQVSEFCRIIKSSTSSNTAVIWGDSLAGAYGRAFVESPALRDFTIYRISVPACGPFPDLSRTDKSFGAEWCSTSSLERKILDYIQNLHPAKVAIIGRWDLYLRGLYSNGNLVESKFYTDGTGSASTQTSLRTIPLQLSKLISELSSGETEVLLFGESPFLDHSPKYFIEQGRGYSNFVTPTSYLRIRTPISEMLNKAIKNSNVKIFSPYQFLCPNDRCRFIVNGSFAFQDDVHISDVMARQLSRDNQFNSLLSGKSQG